MPDSPSLADRDVNKQLSFALYGAANRMARLHKPLLEPLGLTFPQYLVMLELFSVSPQTVGQLGTKLGMDTGTITPLLKRLASSGMVSRNRDPEDERRVLIDLTIDGKALRGDVGCISEIVKSACALSGEGLTDLRDTLNGFARPVLE